MGIGQRFRLRTWWAERRARRIGDPIERLRYLRRATQAGTGTRRIARRCLSLLLFVPAPVFLVMTRAAGRFEAAV
jgi:hypothetical protein